LCRVRRGEHERRSLEIASVSRPKLAQTFDGTRKRELRASETFDEVSAPAHAERLQHSKLRVDSDIAAADALAAYAVARDDSLSFEQEFRERPAIRTLWL
jgi:hypothetical protein